MDASRIREHMEVVGSDGQHVGTVDEVEGQRIKLTKSDPSAQGSATTSISTWWPPSRGMRCG